MSELELCCECDCPTGRAGKGEDSLYAGDFGPYCGDCWYDVPETLADEIANLRAQLAEAKEVLARLLRSHQNISAGALADDPMLGPWEKWPVVIRASAWLSGGK